MGHHDTHWELWNRSNALVKGWIIGSLTEQTLGSILNNCLKDNVDFSAKDIWDELQIVYGSAVLPRRQTIHSPEHVPPPPQTPLPVDITYDTRPPNPYVHVPLTPEEILEGQEQDKEDARNVMLEATQVRNWKEVCRLLSTYDDFTAMDIIDKNGNTAFHIAVGTTKKGEVIKKLMDLTPPNTPFDVRNLDGSTLLHIASIVGNTEAAKILVEKNRDILYIKDNQGQTPLAIALSNMHTETSQLLLEQIRTDTMFSGRSGDELLISAISANNFSLANDHLAWRYRTFHSDAVLMAIAQNFPCELSVVVEYIGLFHEETITKTIFERVAGFLLPVFELMEAVPLCGRWVYLALVQLFAGILWIIIMLFPEILKKFVWLFVKHRVQLHKHALELLQQVNSKIKQLDDTDSHRDYYTNPIHEAVRQNAYEMVEEIVQEFPDAMSSANNDGHDIIQNAVINRSEKVYNLLYQMSEHKNVYKTIRDSSGNNLLHLAGRLAPTHKLNHISGAALQIQRELQWFKEVEGFVCPLNIKQKNIFDETPQMVFTREHKELVIEGERWMKATAESYTITAALITTIVFAAAITVPGGNNQVTGKPVFTNETAFTIFAISDAISLFAAVTSLLMFLSILTTRYNEGDFLRKLPTKLIFGLVTSFISTTAMIIAFGATLYLEFGQSNSKILGTIVALTCVPIICFAILQFSLIIDLMRATYFRSIFGKQRNRHFY
ncbi:hypothetical protein L1887_18162 [Cichorium endivia]|nr:hypothetical protein L1887_18162 [Cichorium endivia]